MKILHFPLWLLPHLSFWKDVFKGRGTESCIQFYRNLVHSKIFSCSIVIGSLPLKNSCTEKNSTQIVWQSFLYPHPALFTFLPLSGISVWLLLISQHIVSVFGCVLWNGCVISEKKITDSPLFCNFFLSSLCSDTVGHHQRTEIVYSLTLIQFFINFTHSLVFRKKCRVPFGNCSSAKIDITFGVHQGSCQSLCLFSLYVFPLGSKTREHGIDFSLLSF